MAAFLTEDVLRVLAENVDCRATLSALSQVSKAFFNIFAPELYRYIRLERCSFAALASISRLPRDSHLRYTQDFRIGHRVQPEWGGHAEPKIEALSMSLRNMTNLRSFA
jgi:hypothetical protein